MMHHFDHECEWGPNDRNCKINKSSPMKGGGGGCPIKKSLKLTHTIVTYQIFSLFRLVNYKFLLLDHLRIATTLCLSTKTDCRVKIAHENLHFTTARNTSLQYCRNETFDKNNTARVPGQASLRLQNLVLYIHERGHFC